MYPLRPLRDSRGERGLKIDDAAWRNLRASTGSNERNGFRPSTVPIVANESPAPTWTRYFVARPRATASYDSGSARSSRFVRLPVCSSSRDETFARQPADEDVDDFSYASRVRCS